MSAIVIFATLLSFICIPTMWYFRGWEYFDDFVYNGYSSRQVEITESGDASSKYLIARYKNRNTITVNQYGNRVTPGFNTSGKSILTLGDSQLFGSGVSDANTFPAFLSKYSGKSVYNGSRKNGLSLLTSKEFRNKWNLVIITSTERNGFSWYCSNNNFDLKVYDNPLEVIPKSKSLEERFFDRKFQKILLNRISGVLSDLYSSALSGNFRAPKSRIINYQHTFAQDNLDSDLNCMNNIRKEILKINLPVVFMLFPAAQTLYPEESSIFPDAFTLNYITRLSQVSRNEGIMTIDSKKCMQNSKRNLYSLHDTHLNKNGYGILGECVSNFLKNKIK